MVFGSHNSMTYLPAKRWWMRLFGWVARCQSLTIDEQYAVGVRLFDLRVAYDGRGRVHFRHGAVSYRGDVEATLSRLNELGGVTVRIVLERVADTEDELDFRVAVSAWKFMFDGIRFVCGVRKDTWQELCGLEQIAGRMLQWCGSMQGGWIGKVCPRLWAKRHPDPMGTAGKEYVLVDFVGRDE